MKKKPSALRSSIFVLSAVTLASPSLFGALNDTFDGDGSNAIATPLADQPGPQIMVDPFDLSGTNKVLRMLAGANNLHNHYAFNRTDVGAYEELTFSFDFRITPGTAGLADGFGFLLIPTSTFGEVGDGPSPLAEEPNVAGAFGIGVDVYPGINNLRTHWDGFQVNDINPSFTSNFRSNNVFNNVQVVLKRVGNATNATISIVTDSQNPTPGTPFKLVETVIPNMLPYESRAFFTARTGGENLTLDLDNVKVTPDVSKPFTGGLPVAPTGHLFQDFDSVGSTGYRAVQAAATNLTVFRPGPLMKAAEPGVSSGAFLRIASDGVEGQSNRVVFNRALDSGATNMPEKLQFDLRFNSADQPADGLGLLFLRTRDLTGAANFTGAGIDSSEEPNHPNMLGLGFDVFSNGPTDPAAVTLHWNGAVVREVPIPAELALGQFHRVEVLREPVADGINVTVSATPNINGVAGAPITLIDHFFVQGATNYDYRVQFSGRTGGLNADHDIDNIMTSQGTRPQLARTTQNFTEATGSGWKGYAFNGGAGPDIRNDGGLNQNFLRLTHDSVNDQSNAIAFDTQVDGAMSGKTSLTARFDFRIASPGNPPADGMSFMLIPTATYGNTGPGAASTPGFIAEEPNVPGVFGIAFDLYDSLNEVSLHWNGSVINEFALNPALLDLDADKFHRLRLELTKVLDGVLVNLTLTPDSLGFPGEDVEVYTDLLIPGMDLYDYRVEFAGRTGGLNMGVDIDNVLVDSVPEPGSVALIGLGALLLARRRRRS